LRWATVLNEKLERISERLAIYCGTDALRREMVHLLQNADPHLPDPLMLVVDAPLGFALRALEDLSTEAVVVITDNPCPEYWDDLSDLHLRALLAGGHSLTELHRALERAAKGERYRKTPHIQRILTYRERAVLRLCAVGLENAEIARELGIAENTVKNHLTNVFAKRNLRSRGQAILYYWGMWLWLERVGWSFDG
jgi:DNA-binding NarL/FixJ family response regulator